VTAEYFPTGESIMEALRLTIKSTRLASIIDLPVSLRECEVDVFVFPHQAPPSPETPDNGETSVTSIMGILKEYANPALRELEKSAWE
jgi:hypothetical protein